MDGIDQPVWYHGSPILLATPHVGSRITQDYDLARVFSHKPTMVVQDHTEEGARIIKHTGHTPGYLYRIREPIRSGDIAPHPQSTMGPGQEWIIHRELAVQLIEPTAVRPEEMLSQAEIDTLLQRIEGRQGIKHEHTDGTALTAWPSPWAAAGRLGRGRRWRRWPAIT